MSDFDLNDMVDFFRKDDMMTVVVLDDDSWVPYECELCGKVATWKKIGVGDFCDRCKEDWPDE